LASSMASQGSSNRIGRPVDCGAERVGSMNVAENIQRQDATGLENAPLADGRVADSIEYRIIVLQSLVVRAPDPIDEFPEEQERRGAGPFVHRIEIRLYVLSDDQPIGRDLAGRRLSIIIFDLCVAELIDELTLLRRPDRNELTVHVEATESSPRSAVPGDAMLDEENRVGRSGVIERREVDGAAIHRVATVGDLDDRHSIAPNYFNAARHGAPIHRVARSRIADSDSPSGNARRGRTVTLLLP